VERRDVDSLKRVTPVALDGLRVVHFHRRPAEGQVSVESLFHHLRTAMCALGLTVEMAEVPYHSKGFLRRIINTVWAARNQGDINHITGDVHFLALGLVGERTILNILDCHALERLSGLRRWLLKLLWFDLPIRRVAVVVAISEATKQRLIQLVRVPADKIEVIPCAVAPIFRPCPRSFNCDCPRILHIGTKPNKNLPRLVDALRGITCQLHVIGPLDKPLRQLLDNSGVAYESDACLSETEIYRAYCDADLVSLVSTYEGFGLPIIEAQWVERPVITSNCLSMPEVAGDGACFVDPFDVSSIRSGLMRIVGDAAYRDSLLELGRKNRQRFLLAEVARQYLSLYQVMATKDKSYSSCLSSQINL
jgi:glycosyltransferase involved in cell wall biosynthesis